MIGSYFSRYVLFLLCFVFFACQHEDDVDPNQDLNQRAWYPATPYFAQFSLLFFDQNPVDFKAAVQKSQVDNFWENSEPYFIQSGGSGMICEDEVEGLSSYLSFAVIVSESIPENTEPPYFKSKLEIEVPYAPNAYDTQEKFYGLLPEGTYAYGQYYSDYGKFVIRYTLDDKLYSSQYVDNSTFQMKVSDKVKVLPDFKTEPAGNNGVPASVEATFTFSCLLMSEDGEYLLIENAKIRGKYYRSSLFNSYWDDWGKGWDSK